MYFRQSCTTEVTCFRIKPLFDPSPVEIFVPVRFANYFLLFEHYVRDVLWNTS
jgi:hypothetical protein